MSYIDVAEHKGKIHCWTRDHSGELSYEKADVPYHLYMRDNTGDATYKDIYGHPMKKVEFESSKKMKAFAESRKDIVAESDVSSVYRFLIDHFTDADTTSPYNVSLFDIEVDFDLADGKGYPTPKNPFGEINAFSIYDTHFDAYVMLIPDHLKGVVSLEDEREGKHVEIVWTKSEKDMLRKFAEYLEHVDITSAWNGLSFDWPYIMERAIILFGDKKAKTMFSRNGIPARRRDFVNNFGEEVWSWSFSGRPFLDMMELFKKFHPGEKKSFALNSICEEVLDEKKIDYQGDLGKLYREDPQKFFEYSLHDSRLMKLLDDKKKVIDLAVTMARSSAALFDSVTGTVKIIEQKFKKFLRLKDNLVLPDADYVEGAKFEGALVYDTIAGYHKWMFTQDITGLYPHVIMALGLSNETALFQCKNRYDDYVHIMDKDYHDVDVTLVSKTGDEDIIAPAGDIYKILKEEGWTISANGTIFNGKMGLLAEFVEEIVITRKKYKKMMFEATDASDDYHAGLYNLYQLVYKVFANSLFGCIGNGAFKCFDSDLAESITITGQVVNKFQSMYTNMRITEDANG